MTKKVSKKTEALFRFDNELCLTLELAPEKMSCI